MAQSLSDIILHIVFSTKDRFPWIDVEIENELHAYIHGICRSLDCPIVQINGMPDHLHLLLLLGKTTSSSKLISEIKSNSSRWIKTKSSKYNDFAWQGGYGVFSVSRPRVDSVVKYISSQKEHHKKITFEDEFLKLLTKSQIPYEEKYLWN